MKLETAKQGTIKDPSREDVERALGDDKARGEFAILSVETEVFVQVAGEAEPFQLEYREGGSEALFAAVEPVSRSEALRVFLGFLEGSAHWKQGVDWVELDY